MGRIWPIGRTGSQLGLAHGNRVVVVGGGGGTPVAHASDVTTAPVVVRVAVSMPKRNEVAGESKRGT
jgi:fibrillarin-like rRNA methylase